MYDYAGNTIEDDAGYKYYYDYENRLIEVKDFEYITIVEYTYNALGRKTQRYDALAGEYTRYYYNKDYQILSEMDENANELRLCKEITCAIWVLIEGE